MNQNQLNTISTEVEAIFTKYTGKLSAWDLDAVFSELRRKALGQAQADAPKPNVAWHVADLIETNLEYALAHYDWKGYAPVATPDGNRIAQIILLDSAGNPPAGYIWSQNHRLIETTSHP